MSADNTRELQEVISDFLSSLDNRSDWFLFYNPALLNQLLDWQKVSWENWFTLMDADKGNWSNWSTIYSNLSEAIALIGKRCITAGHYSFTETFSKKIEKHMVDNQDLKVEGKKIWFYRAYVYHTFFGDIVDFLSAKTYEEEYFWGQFPEEWKITENNFASGKVFARIRT